MEAQHNLVCFEVDFDKILRSMLSENGIQLEKFIHFNGDEVQ